MEVKVLDSASQCQRRGMMGYLSAQPFTVPMNWSIAGRAQFSLFHEALCER